MINKNTIPTQLGFMNEVANLYIKTDEAHNSISDSFTNINMYYGKCSVIEDIITNKMLSLYNSSQSITTDNTKKNIVTESFLSQSLVDTEFPVENPLNMDTQNGTLTLPVIKTDNINVSNIIIETDSNGTAGDSLKDMASSDPSSILNSDPSSLFVYEKIVNSMSLYPLYLSMSLMLNTSEIINGIYIKLYTESGANYPTIYEMECSSDGNIWTKIDFSNAINKADYYIRFSPTECKYIRLKFMQDTYNPISTGFGTRYRYLIGLREISIKQTEYATSGNYISAPIAGKKSITKIILNKSDKGSVSYFVSANNGTKWQRIEPGVAMSMSNDVLGLRDDIDIDSIRIKVSMSKDGTTMNMLSGKEYFLINDSGQYFIKEKANKLRAYVGNHISYGDIQPYILYISDMQRIATSIFVNNTVKATKTLNFVPYYDGIQDDIVMTINGSEVTNSKTLWEIQPHTDDKHSVLAIKSDDIISMNGTMSIYFKPFKFTSSSPIVTLPAKPFITTKDGFIIKAAGKVLGAEDFDTEDGNLIIKDYAFSPTIEYSVSYMPATDISYMVHGSDSNEVQLQGVNATLNARVCIEYEYEDPNNISQIKYFTPICTGYKVELV